MLVKHSRHYGSWVVGRHSGVQIKVVRLVVLYNHPVQHSFRQWAGRHMPLFSHFRKLR